MNGIWRVTGLALVISIVAVLIGTYEIDIGPGSAILFPIIWAVLLGALVSVQRWWPVPLAAQYTASRMLEIGIMLFIVRLGTLIGPELGTLSNFGYALIFQELGHIFGTVILALPIAVAIRMGRSSIGATYSIDREPNLGFMAERFGGNSPEYRGALGVYIIGSVFGALYIGLLAGFVASTGVLHPLALALGAGVGSASMMAASSSAIATQFPGSEDQILAFAGASNLITETIGVYVTIFVSLPLALYLYKWWTRVFRVRTADEVASGPVRTERRVEAPAASGTTKVSEAVGVEEGTGHGEGAQPLALPTTVAALGIMAVLMYITNGVAGVAPGAWTLSTVGGIVFLLVVTVVSVLLKRIIPVIPVIFWTSAIGLVLTAPFSPVDQHILSLVEGVDFLSIATPILAYIGLALGKDIPQFRRLSWRVVVVAVMTYSATFLAAAAIAQAFII